MASCPGVHRQEVRFPEEGTGCSSRFTSAAGGRARRAASGVRSGSPPVPRLSSSGRPTTQEVAPATTWPTVPYESTQQLMMDLEDYEDLHRAADWIEENSNMIWHEGNLWQDCDDDA